MLAILAPVPSGILGDAFEVKNPEGIVAFGTGGLEGENSGAWSFDFFSNPDIANAKGEIPVLIFGSASGLTGRHELHHPGYVTAVARYQGIRAARAGRHPRPDFRPAIALRGDTGHALFWEISALKRLSPENHIPLGKLKLPGTGKLKSHSGISPRGPQLVFVSDALIHA